MFADSTLAASPKGTNMLEMLGESNQQRGLSVLENAVSNNTWLGFFQCAMKPMLWARGLLTAVSRHRPPQTRLAGELLHDSRPPQTHQAQVPLHRPRH